MTRYKVVLVPFPFDDLSSHKVRPAVCLTEPVGPHRHVVLAFITSRVSSPQAVWIDGEAHGQTPFTAIVVPQAVSIVIP